MRTLRAHCQYYEGWGVGEEHPTIVELWEVLGAWDNALKSKLLKAVIGTSRLPPRGVAWKFQVKLMPGAGIICKSSSCFQILELPVDTRKKLDWALRELLASGCVGGGCGAALLCPGSGCSLARNPLPLTHTHTSPPPPPRQRTHITPFLFPQAQQGVRERERERATFKLGELSLGR